MGKTAQSLTLNKKFGSPKVWGDSFSNFDGKLSGRYKCGHKKCSNKTDNTSLLSVVKQPNRLGEIN